MKYDFTIRGSVPADVLSPALAGQQLNFELNTSPETPWNYNMGGMWEFNARWSLVGEVGLGDRTQVIGAVIFRF